MESSMILRVSLNRPFKFSWNPFISRNLSFSLSPSHPTNPRAYTVHINSATDQCTSQARFRSVNICTHIRTRRSTGSQYIE